MKKPTDEEVLMEEINRAEFAFAKVSDVLNEPLLIDPELSLAARISILGSFLLIERIG